MGLRDRIERAVPERDHVPLTRDRLEPGPVQDLHRGGEEGGGRGSLPCPSSRLGAQALPEGSGCGVERLTQRGRYAEHSRETFDVALARDCLDGADASQLTAKRNESVTAPQALALLNNEFVLVHSKAFANWLEYSQRIVNGVPSGKVRKPSAPLSWPVAWSVACTVSGSGASRCRTACPSPRSPS